MDQNISEAFHQLEVISRIDLGSVNISDEELIDNLTTLQNVNAKIREIIISTRIKQFMHDFGERASDIYVATFPKSGTTLMQMMLYQLTTDGNMDFEHLYDVSPWPRYSAQLNEAIPSVGERRIIKTHEPYAMLQGIGKGKFIFVIRDCLDVLSSLHHHTKDYNNPNVDFEEVVNQHMKEWFEYNCRWLKNEKGLDILFIHYEDIIENKKQVIQRIAEFLGIAIDDKRMNRTIERTSIEFMKKHESKFGEQPMHWKVYDNFIRNGKVGHGKIDFNDQQIKKYLNLSKDYHVTNTLMNRYFT